VCLYDSLYYFLSVSDYQIMLVWMSERVHFSYLSFSSRNPLVPAPRVPTPVIPVSVIPVFIIFNSVACWRPLSGALVSFACQRPLPGALASCACRQPLPEALLHQLNMKYYMKNWDNWRWDS
jgi:hypothetical protein